MGSENKKEKCGCFYDLDIGHDEHVCELPPLAVLTILGLCCIHL